jgi:hypothetical protein
MESYDLKRIFSGFKSQWISFASLTTFIASNKCEMISLEKFNESPLN